MSESQLPADCTSRIRQGFAASLLLTSLLFFWILVVANEPRGVGEGLYRGGGATGGLQPKQLAAGPSPDRISVFGLEILHLAPFTRVVGGKLLVARVLGGRMVFLRFFQTG